MTCQICVICGKSFSDYADWEIHWSEELLVMLEDGNNDQNGSSQVYLDGASGPSQCTSVGNFAFRENFCKRPRLEPSDEKDMLARGRIGEVTMSSQIKSATNSTSRACFLENYSKTSERFCEDQKNREPEQAVGRSSINKNKSISLTAEKSPNDNEKGSCPICNKSFQMHLLQQHVEQELDDLELAKESSKLTCSLDTNSVPSCSEASHHKQGVQYSAGRYGFSWMKNTKDSVISNSSSVVQSNGDPLQNMGKSPSSSYIHNQRRNLLRCFSWKGGDSEVRQGKIAVRNVGCSGSLLVLGDDPAPRERSKHLRRKEIPNFNHYADGGGWWDEGSVGIDCEALGSAEIWEGVGFASLGNLGQSI
ncbi:hypothetical protein O6H91_Y521400 [Diphasiastrum complanatum]|nr:hypothetical protein O6H91_Y521400 [Diphasiastrum complanatum]